ncbi:hypothetical protein V1288_004417 [Bradyrhizobium sp. AZCC 2176]
MLVPTVVRLMMRITAQAARAGRGGRMIARRAEFRPILRSTWGNHLPFNEINELTLTKP